MEARSTRPGLREQRERIKPQLRFIGAKAANIKARLALIHAQREALKLQRVSAGARSAAGSTLWELDGAADDGDDMLELEELVDEALDAEARALAVEELAEQALEDAADARRVPVAAPEVEERLRTLARGRACLSRA